MNRACFSQNTNLHEQNQHASCIRLMKNNFVRMKNYLILILLSILSLNVFSQNFQVPKDYKLESKDDYAKYEGQVIACIDWLLATPISQEPEKRQEVNSFLVKWLSGSPDVNVDIQQEIVTFVDSPECLLIFMGGWAKYAIENQDFASKRNGNIAGIESVIEFYGKNKDIIGKNKNIEKYVKLKEKGELISFIQSRI